MRQYGEVGPYEKIACWVCGQTLYRADAAVNAIGKEVHRQCLDVDWHLSIASSWKPPTEPEPWPPVQLRDYWLPRAMNIQPGNVAYIEAMKPVGDAENLASFRRHFIGAGA